MPVARPVSSADEHQHREDSNLHNKRTAPARLHDEMAAFETAYWRSSVYPDLVKYKCKSYGDRRDPVLQDMTSEDTIRSIANDTEPLYHEPFAFLSLYGKRNPYLCNHDRKSQSTYPVPLHDLHAWLSEDCIRLSTAACIPHGVARLIHEYAQLAPCGIENLRVIDVHDDSKHTGMRTLSWDAKIILDTLRTVVLSTCLRPRHRIAIRYLQHGEYLVHIQRGLCLWRYDIYRSQPIYKLPNMSLSGSEFTQLHMASPTICKGFISNQESLVNLYINDRSGDRARGLFHHDDTDDTGTIIKPQTFFVVYGTHGTRDETSCTVSLANGMYSAFFNEDEPGSRAFVLYRWEMDILDKMHDPWKMDRDGTKKRHGLRYYAYHIPMEYEYIDHVRPTPRLDKRPTHRLDNGLVCNRYRTMQMIAVTDTRCWLISDRGGIEEYDSIHNVVHRIVADDCGDPYPLIANGPFTSMYPMPTQLTFYNDVLYMKRTEANRTKVWMHCFQRHAVSDGGIINDTDDPKYALATGSSGTSTISKVKLPMRADDVYWKAHPLYRAVGGWILM